MQVPREQGTVVSVTVVKDGFVWRARRVERPLISQAEWEVAQLSLTLDRLEKEIERLALAVNYNHNISNLEYELIEGELWQRATKQHVYAVLDNLADKYDKVGWAHFERDVTEDFHDELEKLGYQFHADAPCHCVDVEVPWGSHDARCGYVKRVRLDDRQKGGYTWPGVI